MIDLHTHSLHSDGTDRPAELVARAARLGLKAMALTDHDNCAGVPEFIEACRQQHITGLAGVELSIEVPQGTLHIVGLGIDPGHAELNAALEQVLAGREGRNHQILAKLQQLGYDLQWSEVAALAGADVVSRTHFGKALLLRGYVGSVQEAFDKLLAKGQAGYVDRYRLTPVAAIDLVAAAGGVSIVAHPLHWTSDLKELESRLSELAGYGLGGLEAYYPGHSREETIELLRLAQRHKLLVSGGSDYHGLAVRPAIELGRGDGTLAIPVTLLEPLFEAIGSNGHFYREAAA